MRGQMDTVAVAHHYDLAPLLTDEARRAWRELTDETLAMAARIEAEMDVVYTVDPEPYHTAEPMFADIARGRILVSTTLSPHPLWTIEQNARFRLVHDVAGHGASGAGFDWEGEVTAYQQQASYLHSPLARAALFTQLLGQVAYFLVHGAYAPQKCALLSITSHGELSQWRLG